MNKKTLIIASIISVILALVGFKSYPFIIAHILNFGNEVSTDSIKTVIGSAWFGVFCATIPVMILASWYFSKIHHRRKRFRSAIIIVLLSISGIIFRYYYLKEISSTNIEFNAFSEQSMPVSSAPVPRYGIFMFAGQILGYVMVFSIYARGSASKKKRKRRRAQGSDNTAAV